jgi:hypothetical protein
MGRMRVVWIVNLELHGCSPCLCRLRLVSDGFERISFDCVLAHMGFLGSRKLSSCVCHQVG